MDACLDFAKGAFANVLADHVMSDAPALARWLLSHVNRQWSP